MKEDYRYHEPEKGSLPPSNIPIPPRSRETRANVEDVTNSKRHKTSRKKVFFSILKVILALFFTFCFICLIGVLGGMGQTTKNFLLSVFGLSSYAICVLGGVLSVLLFFGIKPKNLKNKTIALTVVMTVVLLLFLQVITTTSIFNSLKDASFNNYTKACFELGGKTSGGYICGIFVYPLLKWIGAPGSCIIFTIIFFALIFVTISPYLFVKKNVEQNKSIIDPNKELFSEDIDGGPTNLKLRGKFERNTTDSYDIISPSFNNFGNIHPNNVIEDDLSLDFDFSEKVTEEDIPSIETKENEKNFGLANIEIDQKYGNITDINQENLSEKVNDILGNNQSNASTENSEQFFIDDDDDSLSFENLSENDKFSFGEDNIQEKEETIIEPINYIKPTESIISQRPSPITSKQPIEDKINVNTQNNVRMPSIDEVDYTKFSTPIYPKRERIEGLFTFVSDRKREEINKNDNQTTGNKNFGEIEDDKKIANIIPPFTDTDNDKRYKIEDKKIDDLSIINEKFNDTLFTPKTNNYSNSNEIAIEIVEDDSNDNKNTDAQTSYADTGITIDEAESDTQNVTSEASADSIEHTIEEDVELDVDVEENDDNLEEEIEFVPRPYSAPQFYLLKDYEEPEINEDNESIGQRIVQALASFDINTSLIKYMRGPTFTSYLFQLSDGVSIKKVLSFESDIKRKLMTDTDITIVESVSGYDAFAIEVLNNKRSTVGLKSMIDNSTFVEKNKLKIAIGVDINGNIMYGDLLTMPHLLIAGSTGTGKSVYLNALICNILFHYSPSEVKLIMIDPKRVELSIYSGIPHMLTKSTISDLKIAINALSWAVNEMNDRYALFSTCDTRSIGEYNKYMEETGGKKLPYIVIIIDELRHLMSFDRKNVEENINSLSSLSRAAGIHLICATQRPSTDVLTGTIKNNIPTRITFKVASAFDSKTVMDRGGAEKLYGMGDMLYINTTIRGEPFRLQGPYISSDEVKAIIEYIKENNDCVYNEKVIKAIYSETKSKSENVVGNMNDSLLKKEEDDLFLKCVKYIVDTQSVSITKLQRVYRLGYSRAARIVDIMEERGYVTPQDQAKSRKVLLSQEKYQELIKEGSIKGEDN